MSTQRFRVRMNFMHFSFWKKSKREAKIQSRFKNCFAHLRQQKRYRIEDHVGNKQITLYSAFKVYELRWIALNCLSTGLLMDF